MGASELQSTSSGCPLCYEITIRHARGSRYPGSTIALRTFSSSLLRYGPFPYASTFSPIGSRQLRPALALDPILLPDQQPQKMGAVGGFYASVERSANDGEGGIANCKPPDIFDHTSTFCMGLRRRPVGAQCGMRRWDQGDPPSKRGMPNKGEQSRQAAAVLHFSMLPKRRRPRPTGSRQDKRDQSGRAAGVPDLRTMSERRRPDL